jgi:hypothetical protein
MFLCVVVVRGASAAEFPKKSCTDGFLFARKRVEQEEQLAHETRKMLH